MPLRSWRREWKKGTWTRRLSGVTSEPSTLQRGVEAFQVRLWSTAATPASPSASPAGERAKTTPGTSGPTFCGCWSKAGPLWASLRTCGATSPKGWEKSSGSSRAQGSLRNGTFSARRRRERRIDARGSSFLPTATAVARWPTPTVSDSSGGYCPPSPTRARQGSAGLKEVVPGGPLNPLWVAWLMGFPIGWTGSEPLGTQSFPLWLQGHGLSSPPEQA